MTGKQLSDILQLASALGVPTSTRYVSVGDSYAFFDGPDGKPIHFKTIDAAIAFIVAMAQQAHAKED